MVILQKEELNVLLYPSSAKAEGEFPACVVSLSPVKFTTTSNCVFVVQNVWPVSVCVYVWGKTIQIHTLTLYSFSSFSHNWSWLFFPHVLAAFLWVRLPPHSTVWQHSWWWAVGWGHLSSGVNGECCHDFVVNLQPHPHLLSCVPVL